MDKENDIENEVKDSKWDFEDYAFTIATVLFAAPMVLGILIAALVDNDASMNIHRWWPFSWMSFMFAWSACSVKDVIDIKRGKSSGEKLENAAEYALYICITTIMLLIGIIQGQMYSSWLAGPIVFVLLMVIWPLLRNRKGKEQSYFPTIPLIILIVGIVAEVAIGGWIAFPVSWILISAVKMFGIIRKGKLAEDDVVDIMYHAFSIILLSTSLIWGSWIISWLAYPASVIIGKVVGRIKKSKAAGGGGSGP